MNPVDEEKLMEQEAQFIKAGPNKRVTAYLIDTMVGGLLGGAVGFFAGNLTGAFLSYMYILFKDVRGRSIGKMAVGIRVVDVTGNTAAPTNAVLRNIYLAVAGYLSLFGRLFATAFLGVLLVEYFLMMTNASGQRLGDMSFGTRVHDDRPNLSDTLFLFISVALFAMYIAMFFMVARQAGLPRP